MSECNSKWCGPETMCESCYEAWRAEQKTQPKTVNVNREGLTYGEFRAAAFAFCDDPNERLAWERAVRMAWQAGEDSTDYANEISKAMAKKAERALARLERSSSSDTRPARVDADRTAKPLTRIAVRLHSGQAYHGAAHAVRDGVWENGNERIKLR